MDLQQILPMERIQSLTASGAWNDKTLLHYFDRDIKTHPDKIALIEHRASGAGARLTYRQLAAQVDRIAQDFLAEGIGPGEVVSFQLPNWWQFAAVHLACLRIGAISNPLMPILRERELHFMLSLAETTVFVTPDSFRGFDHAAMAARLRTDLPRLRQIFVVNESTNAPGSWNSGGGSQLRSVPRSSSLSANDVIQIMYTSGTTGEPKGVMHTSNTLLSHLRPFTERLRMRASSVIFCPSPLAHQLGFLYGLMMPIVLGATVVLQDTWRPEIAMDLIDEYKATFALGATPFLADLTRVVAASARGLPSFETFLSAGAPIPPSLVREGSSVLGASIVSAWGMTENGAITTTRCDDREEKVIGTDGIALEGSEVRVVDDRGQTLPADEEGRLQARGTSLFVGYLKRPAQYAVDAAGWFETGDLARMDTDGYIRITGRAKDVLIRGGENVPVVEVEGVLFRHPAISAVAIVGVPDDRLGERGCAFVQLRNGASLSLAEIQAFLTEQQMTRTYHPEHMVILDEMPRTPSGKIQKFKLRECARGIAAGESDTTEP